MSTVSSLLLALLYVFFYSCNARSLGFVVNEAPAKQLEDSTTEKLKDDEKLNSVRVSTQVDMKSPVVQNTIEEEEVAGFNNKHAESESNNNAVKVTSAESQEFVSWRVPHEKRGEPEVPGFNLDYLPPRTHPPAHN